MSSKKKNKSGDKTVEVTNPPSNGFTREINDYQQIPFWNIEQVTNWLAENHIESHIIEEFKKQKVNGGTLLVLERDDLKWSKTIKTLSDLSNLWSLIYELKKKYNQETRFSPIHSEQTHSSRLKFFPKDSEVVNPRDKFTIQWQDQMQERILEEEQLKELQRKFMRRSSSMQFAHSITWKNGGRDAFSKFFFSMIYAILVCFVTAFTMTLVHDRVPDQKNYPPLPDIFLDNIQMVPWAFAVVEIIIVSLLISFSLILLFHKHRLIVLRRFCAIGGTVFLLRCVTMFATSLSVPGQHLNCDVRVGSSLEEKLIHAWRIMSNFGLSINGVRTCGDYMFSGHTIMLTLLNFFVIEYSPRSWKGLEILSYAANFVGMFFVLAAHEHYTIDVIVAFFISSRLFLYYHSLANTAALKGDDHDRVRSFFPMFYYLEEFTDGVLPNEYSIPFPFSFRVRNSLPNTDDTTQILNK